MSDSSIKLSLIIVNYNGKQYLEDCLQSISKWIDCKHEVILVDNASQDGSADYIRQSFADIQLIESHKNLGFAAGNNRGVQRARGEYILLLNNDTILKVPIHLALKKMDMDGSIGVLGIKMLGSADEYRFSTGYYPTALRLIRFSSLYRKDGHFLNGEFPNNDTKCYPVEWVEGSFLLTRRALWEQLHGLDEEYFMYSEDVDYCKRIDDAGYKVVYFPALSYIHYGGYTQSRMNMLIKGFRRYNEKFVRQPHKFISNMVLSAGLLLRLAVFGVMALTGNSQAREKVAGCWRAWCETPW